MEYMLASQFSYVSQGGIVRAHAIASRSVSLRNLEKTSATFSSEKGAHA